MHRSLKKLMSRMMVLTMILTLVTSSYLSAQENFPGASNWALDELSEGSFLIPDGFYEDFSTPITRKEFSEVVMKLYFNIGSGFYEVVESPFSDTEDEMILAAYGLGIVGGYGNGLFGPDDQVTREQVCTMLTRAITASGYHLLDPSSYQYQKQYGDQAKVSSWAVTSVKTLNDFGIFSGTGDNLDPAGYLTREQAILLAYRTMMHVDDFINEYETHVDGEMLKVLDGTTDEGFDDEAMRVAAMKGYSIPVAYPVLDNEQLRGQALLDTMVAKNFQDLKVTYETSQYSWMDFFDEWDETLSETQSEVYLNNTDVKEINNNDGSMIERNYYREADGTLYTVSEYDIDGIIEKAGTTMYLKDMPGLPALTYNPYYLQPDSTVRACYYTMYEGDKVLYLETVHDNDLTQSFIDTDLGLSVRNIRFNELGQVEWDRKLIHTENVSLDENDFYQEADVDYIDMTLFLFAFLGDEEAFSPLVAMVGNYASDVPIKMTLEVDGAETLSLYGTAFGDSLTQGLTVIKTQDMFDHEVTLIRYQTDERYVTICPEKELVILYGTSHSEFKLFKFDTVRLAGYWVENSQHHYRFLDTGYGSVSGMTDVYEYVIERDGSLDHIEKYRLEEGLGSAIYGDVTLYRVLDVVEESTDMYDFPESYEVIDMGEFSHDDGEHAPYWFTAE